MICTCCSKNEATLAVIDGNICDDCYANSYTFCMSCFEVHPNKNMMPFMKICTGCFDQKEDPPK